MRQMQIQDMIVHGTLLHADGGSAPQQDCILGECARSNHATPENDRGVRVDMWTLFLRLNSGLGFEFRQQAAPFFLAKKSKGCGLRFFRDHPQENTRLLNSHLFVVYSRGEKT